MRWQVCRFGRCLQGLIAGVRPGPCGSKARCCGTAAMRGSRAVAAGPGLPAFPRVRRPFRPRRCRRSGPFPDPWRSTYAACAAARQKHRFIRRGRRDGGDGFEPRVRGVAFHVRGPRGHGPIPNLGRMDAGAKRPDRTCPIRAAVASCRQIAEFAAAAGREGKFGGGFERGASSARFGASHRRPSSSDHPLRRE